MRISLDALIISNCVKYENLRSLIQYAFAGSKADTLNIYVDMYSTIRSLYSRQHVTDIENYNDITAGFINLCAHYREFFRKSLGVHTNIFLVASYNCCKMNQLLVPSYNKSIYIGRNNNKQITDFIEYNFELLGTLCPYLPDIHFIKTEYESSVAMFYIMQKQKELGNNNPNLILSKDPYALQLVAVESDTAYLRPRKYQGDNSYIVRPILDQDSQVEFWMRFHEMHNWKFDDIVINPKNVSNVLSFTTVAERGIHSILNVKKVKSIISTMDYVTLPTVQTILQETGNSSLCSEDTICNRYKAVDIPFQTMIFSDTAEAKLMKFDNLYDPNSVKHINNVYFSKNPLDLERL